MIGRQVRVLCVDDDGNILEAMKRTMRDAFTLVTALGGEDGMARLDSEGPFAVIVSDLRMPVVDGVTLLAHAREVSPTTTRILLTGHADVEQAIRSVNEGNVFRFLTKPCAGSVLRAAILAGIEQHRLVNAERVLQEQTLRGSIRAMTELLSLVHPLVGAQTSRVRRLVVEMATALALDDVWRVEVAALLANLGLVTVPHATVERLHAGESLSEREEEQLARAPETAAKVLANIPHMEEVQSVLLYQRTHFDGSHSPVPGVKGEKLPMAARLLRLVVDFDQLTSHGLPARQSLDVLSGRRGRYDPKLLELLGRLRAESGPRFESRRVVVRTLRCGMVFDEDFRNHEGRVLVGRGAEVVPAMLDRIREYWDESLLARSVGVLVPLAGEAERREAA